MGGEVLYMVPCTLVRARTGQRIGQQYREQYREQPLGSIFEHSFLNFSEMANVPDHGDGFVPDLLVVLDNAHPLAHETK